VPLCLCGKPPFLLNFDAKKTRKLKFTFAIIICLLFITCKKYPEGGSLFSLRDIDNRILGKRAIVGFTVDGIDSLDHLKSDPDFCNSSPFDYQLEFAFNSIDGNTLKSPCATFGNNYWGITDNKKQLKLAYHFEPGAASLYPIQFNEYKEVFWDIQKLQHGALWLKTILNGKEYEIKLELK
jgi:hypothetical protein